jgi:hypothetical protein
MVGRILKTHYNAKNHLAEELIDGGDMSVAWTDERWDESGVQGVYGPQYYSQRGQVCPPRLDANLNEYLSDGEEYAYVFTNGEWVCYDLHETPKIVEIHSAALAI